MRNKVSRGLGHVSIADTGRLVLSFAVFNLLSMCIHPLYAQTLAYEDLTDLSLKQLSEIEIVSASRKAGNVLESSAAVFVITQDSIRRSGVTSIPEALRLAPGVEVAQRDSHSWAISIRGFNNNISNKLLVLIDGRSVYSPLYAGVFWDVQDVLLKDVDRIEVIAGPGGTLWGANAVNGVINIITRSASETQGGFVEIGAGNEENAIAGFRYGGYIGENTAARAYLKMFDRDSTVDSAGNDAGDSWRMAKGGFRMDWEPLGKDQVTFQGDIYSGEENDLLRSDFALGDIPEDDFRDKTQLAGGNLLARWTRQQEKNANYIWQVYYDHTLRDIPASVREKRQTVDIDFQHDFFWNKRHDIVWGAGYRITQDDIDNSLATALTPDSRTDRTFSAFLQDKISFMDNRLFLTLGSKFEYNDYTGSEWQPNMRLAYMPDNTHTLWASISRAVRTPSRLDTAIRITQPLDTSNSNNPVYLTYTGDPDFKSEDLIAYETGYQVQMADNLSVRLALFYNEYDRLQTIEFGEPVVVQEPGSTYTIIPNTLGNEQEGTSHGGTAVVKWQPMSNWRLETHYAFTDMHLERKPDSGEGASQNLNGNTPEHQLSIHSFVNLPNDLSLYAGLRFVDELPDQDVPSYVALNMNVQWRPKDNFTASLTAKNLTDSGHVEFGSDNMNQIERSIFGKVAWKF